MTEPFSPHELMARIKAILKRAAPGAAPGMTGRGAGAVLEQGALRLDAARHSCSFRGRAVTLTATEMGLLARLIAAMAQATTPMEAQLGALRRLAAARDPGFHGHSTLMAVLPDLAAAQPGPALTTSGERLSCPCRTRGGI